MAGTFITLFYQVVSLYGFLPMVFLAIMILGVVNVVFSYTLHLVSLFLIPLPICIIITNCIIVVSFLAWLIINIRINRQANLEIFKLNYSSRTAFIFLSILLCNRILPMSVLPSARFWDVHIKPHLAGKLQLFDRELLSRAIQDDFLKLESILKENAVIFGCTPGSLSKEITALELDKSDYQIAKTIKPPEHALVFGLNRDSYLHMITLEKLEDQG